MDLHYVMFEMENEVHLIPDQDEITHRATPLCWCHPENEDPQDKLTKKIWTHRPVH